MQYSNISWLFLVTLAMACGSPDTEVTEGAGTPTPQATASDGGEVAPTPTTVLYSWVDRLNVRERPDRDAPVIAKLAADQAVTPTGRQSSRAEAVVLRGVLYEEPWVEIQLGGGTSGWAHGGALRSADENKGNPALTATRFHYPYFGPVDLTKWTLQTTATGDGEGDFDRTTRVYRRDYRQLEVEEFEGEYGYGSHLTLSEVDGGPIRERHFQYNNLDSTLTEEVIEYSGEQPIRYFRSQSVPTTSYFLRGRPLMARGTWAEAPYTINE